jgi:dephospho-CoA kinase
LTLPHKTVLRVGLTGGIACGKTVVGEMFARRGAYIIQADRIAHELMNPGELVYNELVSHFGREILDADGAISRPKLAQAAFAGTGGSRVEELNRIVHPAVIRRQEEWMDNVGRQFPNAVAIVEAALIFEAGVGGRFDKIVVVTCDANRKAERFAQRTGISLELAREEVARRSAVQMPDAEKLRRADYVIYNDGPLAETETQVESIWKQLRQLATTPLQERSPRQ